MAKNIQDKIAIAEDKILKIKEQLVSEQKVINKSKAKIKKLKAAKTRLEKELQNIRFSELQDTLQGFGVKSVADLNRFLEEYANSESADSAPTEEKI